MIPFQLELNVTIRFQPEWGFVGLPDMLGPLPLCSIVLPNCIFEQEFSRRFQWGFKEILIGKFLDPTGISIYIFLEHLSPTISE